MSEEIPVRGPQPLPLLQILANLRDGSVINDIDGELAKAVKNVTLTGKSGHVTLKLTISPVAQIPHAIYLGADISSKIPKPPQPSQLLYADAHAGLHRNDPKQMDIFENNKPRPVFAGRLNTTTGEVLSDAG